MGGAKGGLKLGGRSQERVTLKWAALRVGCNQVGGAICGLLPGRQSNEWVAARWAEQRVGCSQVGGAKNGNSAEECEMKGEGSGS